MDGDTSCVNCSHVGITNLQNDIKFVDYPKRTDKVKIPPNRGEKVTI